MPETAVDEYGDSRPGENDVRPTSQSGNRWIVDAIPEARRMENPTNGEFGSGVAPPIAPH